MGFTRHWLAPPLAALADLGSRAWSGSNSRLAILMYHGVVERALEPYCWHQLPLAEFERQMRWVQRYTQTLPLEEALDRLQAGTLPARACAITFDDGYRNVRDLAFPVMAALKLPATVFVVTDLLGTSEVPWPDRLYLAVRATRAKSISGRELALGEFPLESAAQQRVALSELLHALKACAVARKGPILEQLLTQLGAPSSQDPAEFRIMDWEDVRALQASKWVAFGAHTTRHEILSQLEDAQVHHTIEHSHVALTQRLGQAPRVFAYPNGRAADFDTRAQAALRTLKVPYALSTTEGLAQRNSPPLALPRVCIGSDLSFPVFRLLARGLWPR